MLCEPRVECRASPPNCSREVELPPVRPDPPSLQFNLPNSILRHESHLHDSLARRPAPCPNSWFISNNRQEGLSFSVQTATPTKRGDGTHHKSYSLTIAMARSFPYAYISCPCDVQPDFPAATAHIRRSSVLPVLNDEEDEEDKTLNPHDPRSNFSLYPYDQLLYCDECHQIRCPRCWAEEITHWYCPSCLFEVPSSMVKTDGNR